MPPVLNPNNNELPGKVTSQDYDYDYPLEGLEPGDELHRKLAGKLKRRAFRSHNTMSDKYEDWRRMDEKLRTYVRPEAKEDDESKSTAEKRRENKLVMPVSYANLETLLTYMSSAFLRDPIFEYEGSGPEDVLGGELMTKVIAKQVQQKAVGLSLHTAWRDGFAYGIGPAAPRWSKEYGTTFSAPGKGYRSESRGTTFQTGRKRKREDNQLIWEGNELVNIDPYRYYPDPQVSAHEVQQGEYVGWLDRSNLMQLLSMEQNDDSIFNVRYLRHHNKKVSGLSGDRSGRPQTVNREETSAVNTPVDVLWIYVNLIPQEWGLGDKEYPEKWMFGLAGDDVIICAKPLGLAHNQFPVAVCAPDYDGYSPVPASRMGIVSDLQDTIDFLYNSHIQNIRKAVNNQFLVDPSLVNLNDVNNPKPGKLMRMRRAAFGRGNLDAAMKQFEVNDVTRGHVGDAQNLSSFMQTATGATDAAQGRVQPRSTRISSAEFKGSRTASLNRMEKTAKVISMQFMLPIARMFASHTQQLMEEETYVKVAGDWEKRLAEDFGINLEQQGRSPQRGRMKVSPLDLLVQYDLTAHDGAIPGTEDAQTWVELFQVMSQNPKVARNFDMKRVFTHIAHHLGAKNIDQFLLKSGQPPQVQPDEEVSQEVKKGNLVPAEQARQQPPSPSANGQPPANGQRNRAGPRRG